MARKRISFNKKVSTNGHENAQVKAVYVRRMAIAAERENAALYESGNVLIDTTKLSVNTLDKLQRLDKEVQEDTQGKFTLLNYKDRWSEILYLQNR